MKRFTVPIDSIRPHPKNYRGHPDAQVDAIRHSLDQFGQYRPVVVSSDGAILAGHGVWLAQKATGATDIDTVRMDFPADDPRAEKLMVADNELSRMAQDDDRALAALLADVQSTEGLDGTGWDDGGLDALIGEMAAEVVDMPELPDGDRAPFQQMTFTLSDEQAETVKDALASAKDAGPFVDTGNENSNGNALARICEAYRG